MASLVIHYAVAKAFASKNKINDYSKFIEGSFYPDTVEKNASHYSGLCDTPYNMLVNKVDLTKYVQEHTLSNDFEKGYFLHLIVDQIFYHDYCVQKLKSDKKFKDVLGHIGREYTKLNRRLIIKYKLDVSIIPQDLQQYFVKKITLPPKYLREKDIYDIVEYASNIDLEKCYSDIKKGFIPYYVYKKS